MKNVLQPVSQDNRKEVMAILGAAVLISLIIGIVTVAVFYGLFAVLGN